MMKAQHVIWSNYDLDYERDWKGLLEEEYPDMTEEERELLMYEMNNSYLDDERCNLNIQLDCPIIVIADLGLRHGRASGYREIESGNVRDCLYSGRSIEYIVFLRLPQIQVIDHMIPGLQIFFRSTLIVADPFIDLVRKEVCTVLAFLKITAVITE